MSIEKKYKLFEKKNHEAELGGGTARIKKLHESGRKTARERQ